MFCRPMPFDAGILYDTLYTYAESNHLPQLLAALPFSREAHRGQKRKGADNIPYIVHPLTMARHAVSIGLTDDTLLAAILLHDVCEDCGITAEQLPVSDAAREAVRLCTYPEGSIKEKVDPEYYGAIIKNDIACLIKILDRINNVSGMALCFSPARMTFYLNETETYTLQLLERLEKDRPDLANALFMMRYQLVTLMNSISALL